MDRPIKRLKPAGHTELYLRAKTAAPLGNWPGPVSQGIPRSSAQHAQAKRDALMQLLQIGALGLGGGVAGRSLIGLSRMMNEPDLKVSGGNVRPEVRVPPAAWDEKEKLAASGTGPPGDMFQYFSNMLPNISTTRPLGDWWGPSAALATAGGGLVGGYALTDWLLKKEREGYRKGELDEAEKDYQQSLGDEYRAAMMAKNAGDDLGIDALYDRLQEREKQASVLGAMESPWSSTVGHDPWQQGKGWLLAAMLATGAGSGYAMYNHTKDKSKQKLLNKALQARARRRAMMSPAPPLAVTPPGLEEDDRAA